MITIETADNALKTFYLDAVKEALDLKANPLLAKLQKTSSNVVGKDVKKLVRAGVNGGVGAGSETGNLPTAIDRDGFEFVVSLKNLYGTIEISDKALRAASSNEGAFVDILNEEMQALIKSASLNFGRMLYGDGSGCVGVVQQAMEDGKIFGFDSLNALVEGMVLEFRTAAGAPISGMESCKVVKIDRDNQSVYVHGGTATGAQVPAGSKAYVKGSKDYEITGLKALFSNDPIYGVNRTDSGFMKPFIKESTGSFSEAQVQQVLDRIEEVSGAKTNFIVCSWGVRRMIMQQYSGRGIPLETMTLEDGTTALNYNGIPLVADRFCPKGTMYLLNTNDFKIHQLCDWKWLEGEDGKILKQVPGKPVYTATLVKYAELMCENPCGQGMISGITEMDY
jgi:hypothetical protein